MSVDLPAPFSPSSAWISPRFSSNSIALLATSEPKRLVIPRSSRAGASPDIGSVGTGAPALLDLGRDVGDLAVLDLLHHLVDLLLVLRALRGDLAEADAAGLDVEHRVRAALEGAVLDRLDRVEDRHVDLLEGARDDVRAEVALVGVDADALHVLLLGGVERAEAALAGDLEDDLRALRDLVERELLAEVLLDEVLRVAVEGLDVRVGLLGAGLEAGDVAVHRRDLLAADRRDDLVAALVLDVERGERAGEVAGLVLLEQQAVDVLRLALHRGLRVVDDREVRVGELLGDGLHRLGHEEADADHDVVLLLGQRGQVRHVVRVGLRRQGAPLDPELGLGPLEALVGELVERAVVQSADVGDESDLDLLRFRRGLCAAPAPGRRLVVGSAAHGHQAAETEREHDQQVYGATRWHFVPSKESDGSYEKRRQPTRAAGRSLDLQRL